MIDTLVEERELPAHEWSRLVGTELETLWPTMKPATDRIIVVERDGEIIACWALMAIMHVEGLWIAPSERGRAGIARRLWRGMRDLVRYYRVPMVWTGAQSDDIKAMIVKAHGMKVPFDSYILPMREEDE